MIDYNSITFETLQQLIDNKECEDLQLEYKAYIFAAGKIEEKDKASLLKEITAFANTEGGIIIIGMAEDGNGVASKLAHVGCTLNAFDGIQLTIQQSLLAKVRPRLYGVVMKKIEIGSDQFVIVIYSPKSFNKPHAVNDGNKDVFHIRHSNGVTFMSVDELRKQFLVSTSFRTEIKSFRQDRIGMILGNECVGNLVEGAKILLHIIPLWSLEYGNSINIKNFSRVKYRTNAITISSVYSDERYNSDGFCMLDYDTISKTINGYSQVFRNGIIEALDIRMMNYKKGQVNDWEETECKLYEAIVRYSDLLKSLNIPKPWYIFVSFLNAKCFISSNCYSGSTKPIDRDIIHATESVWEDDNDSIDQVIKPTLDSLANAFGMPQSPSYDSNGSYIG